MRTVLLCKVVTSGKDIPFDAVDIDGEIVKLEDEIDVVDLDTIYEINCEDEILARCSSERIAKEAMQKLIEDGGWYEESLEITELELNVIRINDKVIHLGESEDDESDNVK